MSQHGDAPAEEIVVIRRRHSDGDHGHHGGAWKIAYADFMTAMMALFLVMWLINASNTETKASVAAYFSPIKLTDSVSRTKGLQDPVERATHTGAAKDGSGGAIEATAETDKKNALEKLQGDASGTKSAAGDHQQKRASTQYKASTSLLPRDETARAGNATEAGRAFRDPFQPSLPDQALSKDGTGRAVGAGKLVLGEQARVPSAALTEEQPRPAAAAAEILEASAAKMLQSVEAAAQQSGAQSGPAVDVKVEDGALVLSLTDTATFGMFAIGSADPNPYLTKLMQTIAPVILANSERVIIRGHTDGRPYRNSSNSNWRLSMSRAEAAMAMLMRAGIEEMRFERVEAHADRNLKVHDNAAAAGNRRIEIVLRQGKS